MADQKIEVEFSGKSNIDEVTKKAASSMSNMEKNIEGINKKFQSFGKDLFLSVLGPMALLNTAINFITTAIQESAEKTKALAKDSFDLLSKGELKGASPRGSSFASYVANLESEKRNEELLKVHKQVVTERYLNTDEGGKVYEEFLKRTNTPGWVASKSSASTDIRLQDLALRAFENTPEFKRFSGSDGTVFKAPEGFSNVVGVGANPVMEAMSAQLEQQKRQTELLEIIANGNSGKNPIPEMKSFWDVQNNPSF